jgi:D-xylose transport system ATP-binding protein
MNQVLEVSDRVACMYLGRVVADVAVDETTTREFLVELITSGRSGDIGLREEATI